MDVVKKIEADARRAAPTTIHKILTIKIEEH